MYLLKVTKHYNLVNSIEKIHCYEKQFMERDKVLSILNAHQAELQNLGVKSLGLFGSVASLFETTVIRLISKVKPGINLEYFV